MKNWIAITISIVAIAIAMIAMAKVAPIEGLDFDYYGAIIGVLSFLVTLLMGYQIYTVINVKEELKEIQRLRSEVISVIEEKVKGVMAQMDEELNNVLPIMVSIDMNEPVDVISTALSVYGESESDSFAQSFASGIIIIMMHKASAFDEDKKEQFLINLKEKSKYEDVSSYYSHIAKKDGGNEEILHDVELMMVKLINMYVMKEGFK